MNGLKKRDLLALPQRKWDESKEYDSILVINSGKKHDSGWALMVIIGCVKSEPVEIAAWCDDICWNFQEKPSSYDFRNDMVFPCGAIHFWSNKYKYHIGASLSSVDVTLNRSIK
jgi:hypothetical protein